MRIGRLLVILPGDAFGTPEAQALRILGAAVALGATGTVAAEAGLIAGLRQTLPAEGGPALLDLPLAWRRGPQEEVRRGQARATRAALVAARPDAVILTLPWPDRAVGAMAVLAQTRTPCLVLAHVAPRGARPAGLDAAALQAAAALHAEWIAPSAPTAERLARLLGLAEDRVSTIPLDAERPSPPDREACREALRERLGIGPSAPVALFLGRLDAARGADRLPAIAEAFAARTGGVVACRGAGILEAALRDAAGEGSTLCMLDPGAEEASLLAGADMLLMPSRLEGPPVGYLRAARLRVPVVASAEALEALGEDAPRLAAVVDAEDPEAVAEALAACLDPGSPAAELIEAAWQQVESLDPAVTMARLLGRLRRLAAPPPEAPPFAAPAFAWEAAEERSEARPEAPAAREEAKRDVEGAAPPPEALVAEEEAIPHATTPSIFPAPDQGPTDEARIP
ncbi:glycosyltransferase [Roseomonas sp. KE2513]|uniref:glycosyltransferase n=1 Tax=Roseomonas sp. KE2513 TaxID=2479202 RepID=UPI0018DF2A72|nr:glycosyltransferase [Roseomonas sp. KE2513]MBI0537649.1 glycosyltransferase [Roseomonas sp. KE2513]